MSTIIFSLMWGVPLALAAWQLVKLSRARRWKPYLLTILFWAVLWAATFFLASSSYQTNQARFLLLVTIAGAEMFAAGAYVLLGFVLMLTRKGAPKAA